MRTRLLTLVAACSVVLLGLLAGPAPAHAKVHKLAVAKVSIDAPSKWKVTVTETQINLNTKDQSLAISLTHVAGSDLDGAWAEVAPAVSGMLSNASLGDKKAGVIGGMDGYVMTASGVLEGANVSVLAALVRTPMNNQLFVIAIGRVGKYEKHEKDMTKALNSIKGEAPLFNDEGYFQLTPEMQAFAEQVVVAVTKNDQKAFLKLVYDDPEGFANSDNVGGGGETYNHKGLKKQLKKAKKLIKFLGLPDKGDWHIEYKNNAEMFRIWRGTWGDYAYFLRCTKHSGRWWVGAVEYDAQGAGAADEDM